MEESFRLELEKRRQRIRQGLCQSGREGRKGEALLLFSAEVFVRNGDVDHSYRQDSDFFYLTGLEEPGSALLLFGDEPGFVLFVRPRDKERETWDGRRTGMEGAVETYGAQLAHPIAELPNKLADYLENRERLHFLFGAQDSWDRTAIAAIVEVRKRRRKRVDAPTGLVDARQFLHEARLIKTPFEQEKMAESGELAARAHRHAMASCRPGMNEWELQSIIESSFRAGGARRLAYDSIVGSGENATILHYQENRCEMEDGDLVLIDAGCEKDFLASDITRTFPVGGKFSPVQRRLYEIVLGAQLAAIIKAREGNTLEDVHLAALAVIGEGLEAEGLIGDLDPADDKALEARVKHFYMHQTSHYLGMDVHDVGLYHRDGELRKLAAGMAITVEPGIYIAPDDVSVPSEYRGIGIRIEDDLIVTKGAPLIVSSGAPKTVEEIEFACCGD